MTSGAHQPTPPGQHCAVAGVRLASGGRHSRVSVCGEQPIIRGLGVWLRRSRRCARDGDARAPNQTAHAPAPLVDRLANSEAAEPSPRPVIVRATTWRYSWCGVRMCRALIPSSRLHISTQEKMPIGAMRDAGMGWPALRTTCPWALYQSGGLSPVVLGIGTTVTVLAIGSTKVQASPP